MSTTHIHAWDVSQAAGLEPVPDQELAVLSLNAIGPMADMLRETFRLIGGLSTSPRTPHRWIGSWASLAANPAGQALTRRPELRSRDPAGWVSLDAPVAACPVRHAGTGRNVSTPLADRSGDAPRRRASRQSGSSAHAHSSAAGRPAVGREPLPNAESVRQSPTAIVARQGACAEAAAACMAANSAAASSGERRPSRSGR